MHSVSLFSVQLFLKPSTQCELPFRLLLPVVCIDGRKAVLGGQSQNNLKIKASSYHRSSSHGSCSISVFFISHLVSPASLFLPWVQPTCWWRSFVFSRLQPALVTRFDLTYPGVTAANYLASLWSLFWMCLFPPVILLFLLSSSSWWLLLWFICTQEHYVCANVPNRFDIRMKFFRGSE